MIDVVRTHRERGQCTSKVNAIYNLKLILGRPLQGGLLVKVYMLDIADIRCQYVKTDARIGYH